MQPLLLSIGTFVWQILVLKICSLPTSVEPLGQALEELTDNSYEVKRSCQFSC